MLLTILIVTVVAWFTVPSIVGLVAAVIFGPASAALVEGYLEITTNSLPQGTWAITFGRVILLSGPSMLPDKPELLTKVRAHEHVHGIQYLCLGFLFFPLYGISYAVSGYFNCWFEKQAREKSGF